MPSRIQKNSTLIHNAKDFITALFENEVDEVYRYHNLAHTMQVLEEGHKIGMGCKLDEEDILVVCIAALFHDSGYHHDHLSHERKGMEIARRFLEKESVSGAFTDKVVSCIRATRVGVKPNHLLAQIVCDADLSYLGIDGFFDRIYLLRKEWEDTLNLCYNEVEWIETNLTFLKKHVYYTSFARNKYAAQKAHHMQRLQELKNAL